MNKEAPMVEDQKSYKAEYSSLGDKEEEFVGNSVNTNISKDAAADSVARSIPITILGHNENNKAVINEKQTKESATENKNVKDLEPKSEETFTKESFVGEINMNDKKHETNGVSERKTVRIRTIPIQRSTETEPDLGRASPGSSSTPQQHSGGATQARVKLGTSSIKIPIQVIIISTWCLCSFSLIVFKIADGEQLVGKPPSSFRSGAGGGRKAGESGTGQGVGEAGEARETRGGLEGGKTETGAGGGGGEGGAGREAREAGERLARVQAELEVARGRVAAQAAALGLGLGTPAARLDSRSRSLEAEQRNKGARWVTCK